MEVKKYGRPKVLDVERSVRLTLEENVVTAMREYRDQTRTPLLRIFRELADLFTDERLVRLSEETHTDRMKLLRKMVDYYAKKYEEVKQKGNK